ncbi:MAG: MBL fold metallo-hydrolase [Elusimicrobiota bacterium]|nr:MBL fold metallo-hydrolase [Elusimicrobiota bacterium]
MRALLLALLLAPALARESDPGAPAAAAPLVALRTLEPGAVVVTQTRPWSANALLVETAGGDLVLVDALWTPAAMRELLAWVDKRYPKRALLALNTHFHPDRVGGNSVLRERKVPLYASDATVRLMKSRGRAVQGGLAGTVDDEALRAELLAAPQVPADGVFSLERGLKLTVGGDAVEIAFHGAGHSPDNAVVWFPRRKLLFGGCLVLPTGRVGNASDADWSSWRTAVAALKAYPAKWVVPGHGYSYDPALLDSTLATLEKRAAP